MIRLHLVPWNLQMAVKPCLEHLRSRGATVSLLKIPSSTSQLSDFKLYNASHTELLLHKTGNKTGQVLLKQDIQICCPVFLQGTNKWFLSEFQVSDLTASGACVVCNVRDTWIIRRGLRGLRGLRSFAAPKGSYRRRLTRFDTKGICIIPYLQICLFYYIYIAFHHVFQEHCDFIGILHFQTSPGIDQVDKREGAKNLFLKGSENYLHGGNFSREIYDSLNLGISSKLSSKPIS